MIKLIPHLINLLAIKSSTIILWECVIIIIIMSMGTVSKPELELGNVGF